MYGVCFFSKTKTASSYVKSTSFRFSDLWQYISPTTAVLSLVSDDVMQTYSTFGEYLQLVDPNMEQSASIWATAQCELYFSCVV